MARYRTIKPAFWDDLKLAKVSRDARLVFIGMWNFSDDYGVILGDNVWIKSKIFPFDDIKQKKFEGFIQELENIGVIFFFATKNIIRPGEKEEYYYFVKNLTKHQIINRPNYIDVNLSIENLEKCLPQSLIDHGIIPDQSSPKSRVINSNVGESKQEKPKKPKVSPSPPVPLKIVNRFSDAFMPVWDRWIEHKRLQHKFTFKSLVTLQSNHDLLVQMAEHDEQKAIEIVNYSIANTWKSFQLPEKHKQNGQSSTKGQFTRTGQGKASNQSVNQAFAEFHQQQPEAGDS